PTSALDAAPRENVLENLADDLRRLGIPTLAVTHDPTVAAIADWVVVMEDHAIVQEGAPAEVFARPATPAAARLVGVRNLLPGRVRSIAGQWAIVEASGGPVLRASVPRGLALREGNPVTLAIRAEEIEIAAPGAHHPAEAAALALTIASVKPEGIALRVIAEGSVRLEVLVPRMAAAAVPLAPGAGIVALIRPQAMHVMAGA
ncbi:MAG: hypothetical protein ACREFY_19465, partial [Acetobacteraceae bacterium]